MLVALVFVLARNIIKLVVERRRALPFARFRAKLVAVLLSLTIVPAVLVLIAGSEFIRTSIDNWFNAPMEDILASANKIAGDYYHERQLLVSDHANRLARALSSVDLGGRRRAADPRPRDARRDAAAREDRAGVQGRRGRRGGPRRAGRRRRRHRDAGRLQSRDRRSPGRSRARGTGRYPIGRSRSGRSGICCTRAAVITAKDGRRTGVVVATDYLTGDLAARSRRMTQAYENYNQLRVLKRPLTGVYLSFFLMVTLLDSGRLHVDGAVSRQADHAAGADAGRRRAGNRRGPARSTRRTAEQRRVRLARRGVQHDGGRARRQPPQGRPLHHRARAQAPGRAKGGGATSRRFSSASRPASSRSTRRARSRRSTARRRGCSA